MAKWPWVDRVLLDQANEMIRIQGRHIEEEKARVVELRQRVIDGVAIEGRLEEEKRGLHDRIADLERQAGYLREATESWKDLHQRAAESNLNLVSTIVELKREGFSPPPFGSTRDLEKLDLDLADPIMAAVASRSLPGSELETKLYRWALAQMREKDADADKVAQRILDGGTPPAVEV